MNVSEYIVKYLKCFGVYHFFGYQGTMIAYFVDAIGREEDVTNHVCYNEQGASLAACGYAKSTGDIAVAYSTSGPGAINLMQGIADAYYDSAPVLFITGQLNLSEYTLNTNIRQHGFQETDIVSITKPITKMSVQIKEAEEILNILPKAIYTMLEGRRGPVLIDIPMDIQRQIIGNNKFTYIYEKFAHNSTYVMRVKDVCDVIIEKLKSANFPVFIFGNGVNINDRSRRNVKMLVNRYKIPTVTTMLSMDLIETNNDYAYGFLGYAYGSRYANFILDLKADLIISFGAKLSSRQIGLDRRNFAKTAQIIRIDIDINELEQNIHTDDINICFDSNDVIKELVELDFKRDFSAWNEKCKKIKTKLKEVDCNRVYRVPNEIIDVISSLLPDDSTITCDVGQHQVWVAQSFNVKDNQRVLFSGGHGAMGFALPALIGASFDNHRHHFCFVGDGSLQMNIQELQWVVSEYISIKIFVINNHSLGLIRQQQDGLFDHRHYGATAEYGFTTPNFTKVANAYGINSIVLEQSRYPEWDLEKLNAIIHDEQPWLIDIHIDDDSYAYPKTSFGEKMHNQYPYISEEIFNQLLNL